MDGCREGQVAIVGGEAWGEKLAVSCVPVAWTDRLAVLTTMGSSAEEQGGERKRNVDSNGRPSAGGKGGRDGEKVDAGGVWVTRTW